MIGQAEAAEAAQIVAPLLPPALAPAFGESFIRSERLYDEFVYRLALRVVRAVGLEAAAREVGTPGEIAARAGLEVQRALTPVDWLLRWLARRGVLEEIAVAGQPARFRVRESLPDLDPEPIRDEHQSLDASWLPSYVLAETVAQEYPAFLRGERTGEEILFSPTRLRLWVEFFSNDNGLYVVNNLIGAVAVESLLPPGPLTILELGGGLGSAAIALLDRLRLGGRWDDLCDYRFTDVVPAFMRRGQQALGARFVDAAFLRFGSLDMNRSFAGQDVQAASVSLVYAVNTLHVARDLDFTLREILAALAPGGRLVISECIRPGPGEPLYAEFIFNLLEAFRSPVLHPAHRPNGGFLTVEQWRMAMRAAGFVDVRTVPDMGRMLDRFPGFCVAAIAASR